MAIIYSYPTVTPVKEDLILGTDVSAKGNPTKNFTIESIIDLVTIATGDLQFVLDLGNVATGRDINLTNNAFRGSSFITTGGATVSGTTGVGFTNVTSTAFTGTIATAAQPNITSLGALTGLVLDGPISGTNLINNSSLTGAQNDNVVSTLAIKTYVDNKVGLYDTLQEILANGNTTGGSDIVVSAGDDITFTDTSKILMGTTSADNLEIYSDSANSIVIDRSPGALKLQTSLLSVRDEADTIQTISANAAGAVELYHVGDKKIETLVGGAKVTGAFQATTSGTFVDLINTGTYSDSSGDVGTAGQILSSTGTGTNWVTEVPLYNWSLEGTTIPSGTAVTVTDGTNITTTWDAANFDLTIATTGVPDGSGAANQVTYWSDTDTLTGAAGFTFAGGATGKVAIAGELEVGGVLTDGAFTGSSGTYTGYTSITSTDFIGALTGNASTATALASGGAIAITGDTSSTGGPHTYTSGGAVTIPTTIANTTVTSKTLLNLPTPTSTAIAASDSILDAMAKLQGQITGLAGSLAFEGTWNANTDTPTLSGTTPSNGTFYIVSVAGATDLSGITDWLVGDWAIYVDNGAGTNAWQKLDQSNEVLGSGAANKIAKWTSTNTLATGLIADDGTDVTIGNSGNLIVQGNTTLGDADTDTTSIVGPATMSSTARFNVGISLGNNNYGSAGQALTSGGGSATVNTWTTLDNYQYWVLSDGTNTTNINATDTVTFTGASGITVAESAGTITITGSAQPGTGTQYTLPVWSTTTSLGDSMVSQNAGGTELTVSGNGTFTGNVTVNSDSNAIGLRVNGRSSDDIAEINMYENDGTTLLGRIQTRTTEMNIGSITSVPLYLKTNGTTALTLDTSQDATFAGNVGIGTTPDAKLQVQGTNSGVLIDTSTAYTPLIKASGILSDLKLSSVGNGGNLVLEADCTTASIIQFNNGGSERMRIDSSGGVSITPTTSTSFFYGADGTNSYINFETNNIDAAVQLYAGYSSGGYFAVGTKDSGGTLAERMRIDSSGNVTIGTGVINPSIGSDIAITQGSIGLRINDAASAISPTTATSNNDNTVDLGVSNIRFRNLYMGGTGTFGGNVTVNSGNKLILNRTDNAIASELSSSSTGKLILNSLNGEGFDLQNNGTSILLGDSSGNVGINRTSIAQPSSGATTLAIQGTSATKGGSIRLYSSDDSVAAYIYPDNTNGLSINTSTSHPIIFRTAGTERMSIDISGNIVTPAVNTNTTVTIGVANATSNSFASTKRGNLIVQASSAISGGNSMGGGDLNLNAGNSYSSGGGIAGDVNIRAGYNTLGATTASVKVYTGNAERMLIDSSGFVTIKNNPESTNASLTLSNTDGTINIDQSIGYLNFYSNDNSTSSTGGVGGIGVYAEAAFNTSFTPSYMSFYTHDTTTNDGTVRGNVTERMRIESDGDILSYGNLKLEKATPFITLSNTAETESGITLLDSADASQSAKITYDAGSSNALKFYNNASNERMHIDSDGNVGIGIDPDTKLDVYGDIKLGTTANSNILNRSDSHWVQYNGGSTTNNTYIRVASVNATGILKTISFYTDASERMTIGSTGRINMFGLDAKGTAGSDVRYNTSTSELYYLTSSKRYKTNIVNLESSLDKINALRPVRFKDIKTGDDTCGLIAEETFEIIPDVVFTKEIEGFDEPQIEGLNYSDLVPFLIKSIQELKADNDNLKARIETLENN